MSSGNAIVLAGAALIGVAIVAPTLKSGTFSASPENRTEAPMMGTAAGRKRISSTDPVTQPSPREFRRGPDGHFYADAQVNGATVRFMVDTGASVVVLTPEDAQRAGIQLPSERSTAMGVGGPIEVIPVTIDRIAIGGIEGRGVQAAVAEELPVSLLGQSYLSRVGSVEIRGDTMVLR
jgi:aspartyl protease family protein